MSDWEEKGEILFNTGNAAWERGDLLNAEKLFRQLVQEFPDRPEGYNKIGVIFAETGQLQEAEQYFLRALAQDRAHAPALTNLGNIYLERGQNDEAVQHYMLALQTDPEYAAAHRNLGVAFRRQGRYSSYVSHFKRSQRLDNRQARDAVRKRRVSSAKDGAPAIRIPSFVWLALAAVGVIVILTVFRR